MEPQRPSVPDIILPAGWNDPDHRDPACEVCHWDGNPKNLYEFTNPSFYTSTFGRLSRPESSGVHGCVRCRILALATIQASHFCSREIPSNQDDQINVSGGIINPTIHLRFDNRGTNGYVNWSIDAALFISQQSREIRAPRGILQLPSANVDVLPDTSSDDSFLWAKDQIESHRDCCQPKNTDRLFIPTRLINVGPIGPDGDVVLDESMPGGSQYVALSYCWGSGQDNDKTTRALYSDYRRRIPRSMLPQTVQDAVMFTRRLNIQYLWVDRFCIVQDDNEDWNKEARRMFDVYRNSYVTLAAVWGKESNSGLFSTAEDFKLILLADLDFNGQHWPLYMRRYHYAHYEWSGSKEEPLFTRAWTYQERLIAPRVLYFRKEELTFECFCNAACECGATQYQLQQRAEPAFYKSWFYEDVIKPREYSSTPDQERSETGSQSSYSGIGHFPEGGWRSVVRQYTGLNLTKAKDKLIAIKAVADQYQEANPKEVYLSGLWSGSLHRDIIWFALGNASNLVKRTKNVPTWSWASMTDQEVAYSREIDESFTPTAEVIEQDSEMLKLRGRLLPCWLAQEIDTDGYPDAYLSLGGCLGSRTSLQGSETVRIEDITRLLDGKPREKVYLFEIARQNSIAEYVYFLVLSRKTDRNNPKLIYDPEIPDDLNSPHPRNDPNGFVRVGRLIVSRSNPEWRWNWHGVRMIWFNVQLSFYKLRVKYVKAVLRIFGRVEEINLY